MITTGLPGQYMKRAVFDCSRASANDTGVANFNQIMRTTTVSPHHLSRKSLSMWEAYKMTNGNVQHWWTAQLVRSHQVIHIANAFWLVMDAPYVKLKVWPLTLVESETSDRKTFGLDVSEWHLKALILDDPLNASIVPYRVELTTSGGFELVATEA